MKEPKSPEIDKERIQQKRGLSEIKLDMTISNTSGEEVDRGRGREEGQV
jgi:hypothetical protein